MNGNRAKFVPVSLFIAAAALSSCTSKHTEFENAAVIPGSNSQGQLSVSASKTLPSSQGIGVLEAVGSCSGFYVTISGSHSAFTATLKQSGSVKFFTDQNCVNATSSVSFTSSDNFTPVYIKDSVIEIVNITASSSSYGSASFQASFFQSSPSPTPSASPSPSRSASPSPTPSPSASPSNSPSPSPSPTSSATPAPSGVPWASFLDSSRAIDWSSAGFTVPKYSTNCAVQPTLKANDSTAASTNTASIQNALASCDATHNVVNIPAGLFYVNGITYPDHGNQVLRGAGPNATTLVPLTDTGCSGIASGVCMIDLPG